MQAKLEQQHYNTSIQNFNQTHKNTTNTSEPINNTYSIEEAKAYSQVFSDSSGAVIKFEETVDSEPKNEAVEKFLYDLRTKGAAQFLNDLNKEKIEKLVEEFKQKLIETMGDSPEAMVDIEKLVENFKKQLLEEMKERFEDEAKRKKELQTPQIQVSKNPQVQEMLNFQTKKSANPLEELLKN